MVTGTGKPEVQREEASHRVMRRPSGKYLSYFKANYVPISKWTSIASIALSVVVLAMTFSVPLMGLAVRWSLIPVLFAAAAWSIANQAKHRGRKLFAILALWISLGGVAWAQIQYYSLLQGAQIEKVPAQTQEK
jgi:hypothetical protein